MNKSELSPCRVTSLPADAFLTLWRLARRTGAARQTSVLALAACAAWVQVGLAPAQDCLPPPAGLVGWWRAEGDALDSVGGNNGVFYDNDDTGLYAGKVGTAFTFGPNNSLGVQVASPEGLSFANNFSFGAWFYEPNGLWLYQQTYGGPPGDVGIILRKEGEYDLAILGDNTLRVSLANTSPGLNGVDTGVAVPVNQWNHVMAVYDQSVLSVYLNGALVFNLACTGDIVPRAPGLNFCIGSDQEGDAPFLGQIDEVAVWNRPLGSDEVAALYAAGSAGMCPPTQPPPLGAAADGSLDTTWTVSGVWILTGPQRWQWAGQTIDDVFVDPVGRIYLCSRYIAYDGSTLCSEHQGLVRLNADGSLDSSFQLEIPCNDFYEPDSLAFQPDGKIVFGGSPGVYFAGFGRLSADGSPDFVYSEVELAQLVPLFGGSYGEIVSVAIQPDDGKILACISYGGSGYVARFNADFSPDNSFAIAGLGGQTGLGPAVLALQGDGKILVGGGFGEANGHPLEGIARFNADGSLDSSFVPVWSVLGHTLNPDILDVKVQEDGKILVGGGFTTYGVALQLLRFNSDGSVDQSFVPAQSANYVAGGVVRSIIIQPDGQILIGGDFDSVGGVQRNHLARLNTDGSLDTTFVPDDIPSPGNSTIESMALVDSGHLLVAGGLSTMRSLPVPGSFDSTAGTSDGLRRPPLAQIRGLPVHLVARVLIAPAPLSITGQPQDQTVIAGSSVTLPVVATGTKPLGYQWRKDGAPIPGAFGYSPWLPQVALADAGVYDVIVSNPSGSINSAPATLTVLPALHPVSYSMYTGSYPDNTYNGSLDPSTGFESGGLGELTDGIFGPYGTSFPYPDPWVRWNGGYPDITFDFGQSQAFAQVAVHTEAQPAGAGWGVFENASVSFSDDGVNFGNTVSYTTPQDQLLAGTHLVQIPAAGSGRYVRVSLYNSSGVYGGGLISEVLFGAPPPPVPATALW